MNDPDRKEIPMSDQQIMERVAEEIRTRSDECERGVIAIGCDPFTGEPVAAMALIGPNNVVFTLPVDPERGVFLDFNLN